MNPVSVRIYGGERPTASPRRRFPTARDGQATGTERASDRRRPEPVDRSAAGPSPDEIFTILSNHRRRRVCHHLVSGPGSTTVGALSESIAAAEHGVSDGGVSSSERKRVYVALYQHHLPKMDDVGAIVYDAARKTVRAGEHIAVIHECLLAVEEVLASTDAGPSESTTLLSSLLDRVRSRRGP